jgi:hypothetical protein
VAGASTLERAPRPQPYTFALVAASLAVLLAARTGSPWNRLLVALAIAQGIVFFDGTNPAVPRRECFPPTKTEAILARELGGRRYLGEPGVLPPNTGMVRELACADGYDGLDPASFDGYRSSVVRPGVDPLLGFHARGADLDGAPFRLLGVGALALAGPLVHPGWQLVAGPDSSAPETAECWIYRASDPLPQTFCVGRVVPKEDVLADLARFDPRAEAFLEDGATWSSRLPCTSSSARITARSNNEVRVEATLDGDGVLVLCEQHFPGWRVEVDGERAPLLRVNSIFRGVALAAGEHRVTFTYAPTSVRAGLACSAGALALIAFLLARARWAPRA